MLSESVDSGGQRIERGLPLMPGGMPKPPSTHRLLLKQVNALRDTVIQVSPSFVRHLYQATF